MAKQEMISAVLAKLAASGIQAIQGDSADITVEQEFLDAGWSSGNKKIDYHLSAYFAENESTVYLWELTKEKSSGFSFGSSSDGEFQFGKTLYRKMKSVQYGPEGKVFEIDLDLGVIPKAFKDTAKQYGWKFKQVLRKEKASYPPGMTRQDPTVVQTPAAQAPAAPVQQPVQSAAGEPPAQKPQIVETTQPQYQRPADIHEKRKNVGGKLFPFVFILLTLVMLAFTIVGKNTAAGWISEGILLLAYLFIGKAVSKKGCLLQIILFIAIVFALLVAFGLTAQLQT